MKAGSSRSIPIAMVFQKFYCHTCGEKLYNNPCTRLVSPKDDDYKKHSSFAGGKRMFSLGDIEVTTYNFKCPCCKTTVEFRDQVILRKIQKKNGTVLLTDAQIEKDRAWATAKVEKQEKIWKCISYAISVAIILLLLWHKAEFSVNL